MLLEPVPPGTRPGLTDEDAAPPQGAPTRPEARKLLKKLRPEMNRMQRALYAARRRPLLVVLQARDAGGKDGTIRRVLGSVNPQGCTVTTFGRPTELELRHDFLWRVHEAAPAAGMIGVFNRSHYEDVLVVRVRKLVPVEVWSGRYEHIVAFEKLLLDSGVTILKLMLHISREEQRRRLVRRLQDPSRNWKFDAEDLRDRARWDDYTVAYQEAVAHTSTPDAPWYVVPADDKRIRNYLVAELITDALRRIEPRFPEADESVQGYLEALG